MKQGKKGTLKTMHERLVSTLENMTDAFVSFDRNWRYSYMNRRAGEIFGRNPQELIGKHIWTEFPEGIGQPFQLAYERTMREQCFISLEEYYPPYDKWFENRIYPSEEGLSIFFSDITGRKKSEQELRKSRELFKTLTCNSHYHIILQDKELRYKLVINPQLDLTEEEMIDSTDFFQSTVNVTQRKREITGTILIAEDEDFNFMFLEEIFIKEGFQIIRAVNGADAVEICKSNPHISLVLMDIKMPVMNGHEATRQIRELRSGLPIIAQTAYSRGPDFDKALKNGCIDLISKPFTKDMLISKISEHIRSS